MNEIITLLPLITVFIIFYVILYIPQRRRQKKHKEYVENLKIGDNVITCLLYTSPSPRDMTGSRMPSSA